MQHDPPDAELVERVRGGDKDAFGVLAERYLRMISILAYQKTQHRSDAEDITQEAFVRAYRALHSLRDPARFAAWLYHITLKLCIDWSRRKERRTRSLVHEDETLQRATSNRFQRVQGGVERALEVADEHARVLSAVSKLPDKYRLVMTLRYVQNMSYREIASHLSEPPGTIANRLHRANRMLQRRLNVEPEERGEGLP